mgnify:FL=1
MGLSLVFSIVEDLEGDIDIISPANKINHTGTQVILRFPCYHDESESNTGTENQQANMQQAV